MGIQLLSWPARAFGPKKISIVPSAFFRSSGICEERLARAMLRIKACVWRSYAVTDQYCSTGALAALLTGKSYFRRRVRRPCP